MLKQFLSLVGLSLAISSPAIGQQLVQAQKLAPDDLVERSAFGTGSGFDGRTLVVGASGFSGASADEGVAYVYARDGSRWLLRARLSPVTPEAGGLFGFSAAVWDDRAAIGSLRGDGAAIDSGTVVAYERIGSGWTPTGVLSADDGVTDGWFGHSLALRGDTLAVGAPRTPDGGAVYVFQHEDGLWRQAARLVPGDAAAGAFFGASIAIDGQTMAVGDLGAMQGGVRTGAVYVFERIEGSWVESAKLVGSGLGENSELGWDVDIDGDRIVAGAIRSDFLRGRAFVFRREGPAWIQEAEFLPPAPTRPTTFGTVAIRGDTVAIGAQNDGLIGPSAGAVFVYVRRDGQWVLTQRLAGRDTASGDLFGNGVHLKEGTLVVTAALADADAVNTGAAYVFEPNPCPADFDADGVLTIFDFLAFQNAFHAMDPLADFDGDGELTILDFLAFQTAFAEGCP